MRIWRPSARASRKSAQNANAAAPEQGNCIEGTLSLARSFLRVCWPRKAFPAFPEKVQTVAQLSGRIFGYTEVIHKRGFQKVYHSRQTPNFSLPKISMRGLPLSMGPVAWAAQVRRRACASLT